MAVFGVPRPKQVLVGPDELSGLVVRIFEDYVVGLHHQGESSVRRPHVLALFGRELVLFSWFMGVSLLDLNHVVLHLFFSRQNHLRGESVGSSGALWSLLGVRLVSSCFHLLLTSSERILEGRTSQKTRPRVLVSGLFLAELSFSLLRFWVPY